MQEKKYNIIKTDKIIFSTNDTLEFYTTVLLYAMKRKNYSVRIIHNNSECRISVYACADITKDVAELLK